MAARPLRWPTRVPGNNNLAIGYGVAQGLNQAIGNYAKMKLQQAQIAAHQATAEGMAQWRAAQAKALNDKNVGGALQDIKLGQIYLQANPSSEKEIRPLIKDRYQYVLDHATPDQKQALISSMENQIKAGRVPREVAAGINLNENSLKAITAMGGQQAGIERENLRAGASRYGADRRLEGTQLRIDSKNAAQVSGDIVKQMKLTNDAIRDLDKPIPPGAQGMDDSTKRVLKQQYQDDLRSLHSQLMQAHSALGASSVPAGASAVPKPYSWDQKDQAPVGASVLNKAGTHVSVKTQNGWDNVQPYDANTWKPPTATAAPAAVVTPTPMPLRGPSSEDASAPMYGPPSPTPDNSAEGD